MVCAAIVENDRVILFKKHPKFNFCRFFKSCHRMIHGCGSMRFGVFGVVKILLVVVWIVVPSDLVGEYKVVSSTCCHVLQERKYFGTVSGTYRRDAGNSAPDYAVS